MSGVIMSSAELFKRVRTLIRRVPMAAWPPLLAAGMVAGLVLTSSSQGALHWLGLSVLAVTSGTPLWFMNRWRRHVRVAQSAQSTWQALLDGSQDAVMVVRVRRDDTGKRLGYEVSRANQQAVQWFGQTQSDLIGMDLAELFPQPQYSLFFQRLNRARKTRTAVAEEHLYAPLHLAGSGRAPTWLHHQIIPIPEGVALVSRDTTASHEALQAIKQQELFYRTLVDTLPIAVSAKSVRPENRDRILVWNQAASDTLQLPTEDVVGKTTHEVMPDELATRNEQQDALVQQNPTLHHFQSVPMRTAKGDRLFDVIKSPVWGADGQIDHILTITRDMTEHRLAADKWRLASRVMEETGDAVVISDALDRILMVNPAFCRLSGMSPSEVTGRNAELIGLMPLRESHLQGIDAALKGNQRWAGETQQIAQNGETLDLLMRVSTLRNEAGRIVQHIRVMQDISVSKAREREHHEQTRHDALTGLPNARAFEERLDHAVERARRSKQTLAVLYVDLDGFAGVNNQHGREAGDRLLVEAANRMRAFTRITDTVCRLAGDEFTLILEEAGQLDEVERICGRIVDALSLPFDLGDNAVVISASVGVALWEAKETAASLCVRADKAMHSAKRAGKDRYAFATQGGTLDLLMTPKALDAA